MRFREIKEIKSPEEMFERANRFETYVDNLQEKARIHADNGLTLDSLNSLDSIENEFDAFVTEIKNNPETFSFVPSKDDLRHLYDAEVYSLNNDKDLGFDFSIDANSVKNEVHNGSLSDMAAIGIDDANDFDDIDLDDFEF